MKNIRSILCGVVPIVGLLFALGTLLAGVANAGTLDRIRQTNTLRIAYREDAPPFSIKGTDGLPAGFMVELCSSVAEGLKRQLGLSKLDLAYVSVTSTNRFEAIQQGKADMLCEATSETLSRRKIVDFSIPTFADGASLLIRSGGPTNVAALAGQTIGVLGGTTTEQALRNTLKAQSVEATVLVAKTHAEGLQMLEAGKISAYFADRAILQFLQLSSTSPGSLELAENYLTIELYALALPHGDEDFRLAVDTALSRIYRSGEITRVFRLTFGPVAEPSNIVKTLYAVSGLQE